MRTRTRAELEEMYDVVDSFSEGLAKARKGTEWFHIRHDGSRVD